MRKDFYQSAMQNAPVGYACGRMVCGADGQPCGLEFIEVNRYFARFFGLREEEMTGGCRSERLAWFRHMVPEWIPLLESVSSGGGEKEVEQYSEILERRYRMKAFSPEKDYFILYVSDMSAAGEYWDKAEDSFGSLKTPELNLEDIKSSWQKRLNEIADILRRENDLQFRQIMENLPFSLSIIAPEGRMLYVNAKFMELFELEESVIGMKAADDFWADPAMRAAWLEELNRNGVINDFEMHAKTSKGREFWAIASGILFQYQGSTCVLAMQFDITERKQMESALKASEEKYRLLTEFTSDVIWILNLKRGRYTYISPSIYYLTGYTPEETMEMTLENSLTQESGAIVQEAVERHLQEFLSDPGNQKSYILEIRQKCKNGDVIWVEVSSKYRFNDAGEPEIVGVSRDIEERKKSEREVLFLSYHDQLTGLYNRRFYEEELQRMNFQRNLPVTLVIADVNGLKLTNDAFGHFVGDELLKQFTEVLNRELRAEDVAARIGGDEFALLLPKTDSEGAEELIGLIREGIRTADCESAILSVSFGWATKESVEEEFDVLFIQAEDKMYHTKLIESTNMKNETIRLALQKLFRKNAAEQSHSERVGKLCREIGAAMGLSENELRELESLGRIHDIGKIGIQEGLLGKRKALTETDWIEVRRHPEVGYQILRSADEYVHIAESVLSHHERADGNGYPRKLKRNEIPLPARILSVAEAYDTMLSGTVYKKALQEQDARKELISNSGTQFDGEIVELFVGKVLNNG